MVLAVMPSESLYAVSSKNSTIYPLKITDEPVFVNPLLSAVIASLDTIGCVISCIQHYPALFRLSLNKAGRPYLHPVSWRSQTAWRLKEIRFFKMLPISARLLPSVTGRLSTNFPCFRCSLNSAFLYHFLWLHWSTIFCKFF